MSTDCAKCTNWLLVQPAIGIRLIRVIRGPDIMCCLIIFCSLFTTKLHVLREITMKCLSF